MTEETLDLLARALTRAAMNTGDLILVWRASLPPERLAVLCELEERGIRIGAHFTPMAGGLWMLTFTATDARGGVQLLDSIETTDALPVVN